MMAAEMPICVGFVNKLPDHRVQIAAIQALFAISLFIESPVIDLLATSTTLGRTSRSFSTIRRFTKSLMVCCAAAHLLIAVTPPLFEFVFKGLLGLPNEVAEAVHLPMLIMVPWTPAIGWRRHVQGFLIRNGLTRPIGTGTLLRVITIFLVTFAGFLSHKLPGAVVASLALASSVVVEAIYINHVGRMALSEASMPEGQSLTTQELAAFHLPLSVSTMVALVAMPMTTRSLAEAPSPLLAMNSWQISLSLAFLLRTMTFALPEVVIANWKRGHDARLLFRFCLGVGLGLTLLMLLLGLLRLDEVFFRYVTQADADVAHGAHIAFLACAMLPTLTAATSYVKGVLTLMKVTVSRLAGTLVSMAVLAGVLALGVSNRWPGVVTAASAVTLSQLAELVVTALILVRQNLKTAADEKTA